MGNRSCAVALSMILSVGGFVQGQQADGNDPQDPLVALLEQQQEVTSAQKQMLLGKILSDPNVSQALTKRKLRLLTVAPETSPLPGRETVPGLKLASTILFDYTEGRALSVLIDLRNGRIVKTKYLKGQPPASDEEKVEAIEVIKADPELRQVLTDGALVEGGFVVDDPAPTIRDHDESPHRYVQFQLLSHDRSQILWLIHVDMTDQSIFKERR